MIIGDIPFRVLGFELIQDARDITYDYAGDYFEEFRRRASTQIGADLHHHRASLVSSHLPHNARVLDYGCGYGVNAIDRENWVGWDVNPFCQQHLKDNDAYEDPADAFWYYDAVCLFDVLEHLQKPAELLDKLWPGALLFLTLPVWDDWSDGPQGLVDWKHWKPGEHLIYGSSTGWKKWIISQGFELLTENTMEVIIGREDIRTFVFKKR